MQLGREIRKVHSEEISGPSPDRCRRHEIFLKIESKDLQSRLLYPARLSFKMEGEIKSSPDKRRLKRVHLHQTSTARHAKGIAMKRGKKRERRRENTGTDKTAMSKYVSIITLNVNGLNAPIKRPRVAE